jgi:diguanylate cyclase (GGDEF)-like protein
VKVDSPRAYLAACTAAMLAAALPILPVPAGAVGLTLGASAGVAIGASRLRGRARPAGAWWLLSAASMIALLSVAAHSLAAEGVLRPASTAAAAIGPPSVVVAVVAALMVMLRRLAPDRDLAGLLDAGIVGFAMFSVLWVLVVQDHLTAGTAGGLNLVVAVASPLLDVLLLAVAVRLGLAIRLRTFAFALVVAGAVAIVAVDVARQVAGVGGTRSAALLLMPCLVLFGAAALDPASAHDPGQSALPAGWLTPRRFALIFVATLVVPMVDLAGGDEGARVVVTTSSAVLFILVLTRVYWLMTAVNRSHERLEHVAFHDPLTGLANRSLFADRVRHALLQRDRRTVTVLLVDLDDFKTVNDSLGHQAGDALLVAVAARLATCIREGDTVARLGGDEFAVLVENPLDGADAAGLSQRILNALSQPARFADHELVANASIGIASAGPDDDVDSLLRNADVAMYLAKSRGKNCFEFFEESMYDDAIERLGLKTALASALEHRQFELHYQPIVDLADQRLVGVEALLRWRHPERGLIPPGRFIPLAEETGAIVDIGRWVLEEACTRVRRWQTDHPDHAALGVSVNLSVRQMRDPGLVGDVAGVLARTELAPHRLTVEITESQLMEDTERSAELIGRLKALGVRVAIDDFGTGYSSLAYLRSFPFDVVKIDRSFVNDLSGHDATEALVRSVIYLADALGATVTAEGIEGFDQAEVLAALGCHHGQGFLISRPLPPEELEWLLTMPMSQSLFAISTLRDATPRRPEVGTHPLGVPAPPLAGARSPGPPS